MCSCVAQERQAWHSPHWSQVLGVGFGGCRSQTRWVCPRQLQTVLVASAASCPPCAATTSSALIEFCNGYKHRQIRRNPQSPSVAGLSDPSKKTLQSWLKRIGRYQGWKRLPGSAPSSVGIDELS